MPKRVFIGMIRIAGFLICHFSNVTRALRKMGGGKFIMLAKSETSALSPMSFGFAPTGLAGSPGKYLFPFTKVWKSYLKGSGVFFFI
jgi:hypothetical protein